MDFAPHPQGHMHHPPLEKVQRWLQWRLRWLRWRQSMMPSLIFLWASLIGGFAALMMTCMHRLARFAVTAWQSHGLAHHSLALIGFAALGGLGAAILLRWAGAQHVVEPLEAVALDRAELRAKPVLIRCGASLVSIVSGASIGSEGVIVQLVTALTARWAQFWHWAPPRRRLLMGCSIAAAMAAAYKAPLAGALFVAEIVLGTVAVPSFAPLLLASTVAAVCMGQYSGEGAYLPLKLPLDASQHGCNGSVLQILSLLPLALGLGVAAPAFVAGLAVMRRKWAKLVPSFPLRMMVAGLLMGLLLPYYPMLRGSGELLLRALFQEGQPVAFSWPFFASIIALKALATMMVVAAGAVGGVLTPLLLMGAGIGWLYGTLLTPMAPDILPTPLGCALLALSGFVAATTHAPLMAILLIMEWTMASTMALPLIVVTLLAHQLATWLLPTSIYGQADWRQTPMVQHHLSIAPWICPPAHVVRKEASFAEVVACLRQPQCEAVLVVDDQKVLLGAIWLTHLQEVLDVSLPPNLVTAADLMQSQPAYLLATADLATALNQFAKTQQTSLPVCLSQDHLLLLGWLHERDVLLGLSQWTARATMQLGTGWRSAS